MILVLSPTCGAVFSLRELDLDLLLPGDELDAAAFRPHDGTVVALRDGHLHAHLGLLLEKERGGKTHPIQEDLFQHVITERTATLNVSKRLDFTATLSSISHTFTILRFSN